MDLNLFHTVDPKVFILKGTVKIKQDVGPKSNWIGNVPFTDKPFAPLFLFAWHFEDNKSYDFVRDSASPLSRPSIIDHDNRLIVYGDFKARNTLYFNGLVSV
jgi:hypothetical protein